MTVLEPGPGMRFFTIPLARLVGDAGRVIAVDMEPKMIEGLRRRAAKAKRARSNRCGGDAAKTMGLGDLQGTVDFVLAFAIVHEFPDAAKFFAEVAQALKLGGTLLLAEPQGHVSDQAFNGELGAATAVGLAATSRPIISRSHAAFLVKN